MQDSMACVKSIADRQLYLCILTKGSKSATFYVMQMEVLRYEAAGKLQDYQVIVGDAG